MEVRCHNCGARYIVRDDLVADGPKRSKCRKCGSVILIKAPEPAAETTPPEALSPAPSPAPPPTEEKPPAEAEKETGDVSAAVEREESPEENDEEEESSGEGGSAELSVMAKLEKRRQEMEDEITGRLHKAALDTLDFHDLEFLAEKIKAIKSNPDYAPEEGSGLYACINCKLVFALFPDDPRTCCNCQSQLIREKEILKQFGMFRRL